MQTGQQSTIKRLDTGQWTMYMWTRQCLMLAKRWSANISHMWPSPESRPTFTRPLAEIDAVLDWPWPWPRPCWPWPRPMLTLTPPYADLDQGADDAEAGEPEVLERLSLGVGCQERIQVLRDLRLKTQTDTTVSLRSYVGRFVKRFEKVYCWEVLITISQWRRKPSDSG